MEFISKVCCFLFILFSSFFLNAQISFYNIYSGSAFDNGQGVTQLPDSSYALTGGSGAFSSNSGQAYLMLIDSLGNHIWTESFGGNGSDWGRRVFFKPGEGFLIAGTTNSTTQGEFNFYFIRTDLNGNLLFENDIGSENWERLWDAELLDDGGMIMVGESEGQTTQKKDMYIARVDEYGDTLWTRQVSTGEDDVAYAVDLLNDTTIVIGGYSWDSSKSTGVILSYHINGSENWRNFFGNGESSSINSLDIYDNQIYGGGEIVQTGEDQSDLFLLKIDSDGNEVANNIFAFNDDERINDLVILDDTSLYITWTSISSDLGIFPEGEDVFISRFNKFLYFENFSNSYSGVNPDIFNQSIATNDGAVLFAGTCGNDRLEPTQGTSIMAVKIGPNDEVDNVQNFEDDIVNLNEEVDPFSVFCYPNPVRSKLFIPDYEKIESIEMFDIQGERVFSVESQGELDLTGLNNGVYLLHLHSFDGQRIIQKIIKR